MSEASKAKGPASYFSAIEKNYGQPIDHWMNVLGEMRSLKHMEMVNTLKAEHGIGHGHANALMAHYRDQNNKQ